MFFGDECRALLEPWPSAGCSSGQKSGWRIAPAVWPLITNAAPQTLELPLPVDGKMDVWDCCKNKNLSLD